MKLSQAKNIVAASIDSQIQNATGRDAQRVIPYLIGGAGLGKTSVIQQIAEERDHGCWVPSLLSSASFTTSVSSNGSCWLPVI